MVIMKWQKLSLNGNMCEYAQLMKMLVLQELSQAVFKW